MSLGKGGDPFLLSQKSPLGKRCSAHLKIISLGTFLSYLT